MVHAAIDRWRDDLAFFLEPRPGKIAFALRIALICALTVLAVEIYQTPGAALTIYIVFFLNQKERATSLLLSLVLLALLTVLVGLIFLIAAAVLNDSMWRVIAMALTAFAFLFLASTSKLSAIGGIMALIVAYALDVLALAPVGEAGTRALLYAWLLVGIPACVSILVNLAVGIKPRTLAGRLIAWRLSLAAQMLRRPNALVHRRVTEVVGEGSGPTDAALRLAAVEKTSPPEDIAALRGAAASSMRLLAIVNIIARYPVSMLPQQLSDAIAEKLDAMAAILDRGLYPVDIDLDIASQPVMKPLAAAMLAEIKRILAVFTSPPETAKPAASEGGFLVADAFTNPDHVRYALKATAAAMFCYFLYTVLDWPGIHTCFITVFIVSLTTTAETIEKLSLRIAGCLIGAGTGLAVIIFLLPHLMSIGELMLLVFAGAFVSAYIAGSSPRIAYAGFQIAFAFFLCVVQGNGPQFDLAIARDRVVGILVGNIVTYLVFTNIYPVSIAARVDAALARAVRMLATAPASVGAAIAAVASDLSLARYEPARVRPSPDWLAAREDAVQAVAQLQGPLFLEHHAMPSLGPRVECIAHAIERPSDPFNAGPREAATGPLQAIIEAHLHKLEQDAAVMAAQGRQDA